MFFSAKRVSPTKVGKTRFFYAVLPEAFFWGALLFEKRLRQAAAKFFFLCVGFIAIGHGYLGKILLAKNGICLISLDHENPGIRLKLASYRSIVKCPTCAWPSFTSQLGGFHFLLFLWFLHHSMPTTTKNFPPKGKKSPRRSFKLWGMKQVHETKKTALPVSGKGG